jgi:hypothetical protein
VGGGSHGDGPAPALEVGPVAVYDGEAGQGYVDESVDAMPIVIDVGLVRLGVDPANLLGIDVEPNHDVPPTDPAGDQG